MMQTRYTADIVKCVDECTQSSNCTFLAQIVIYSTILVITSETRIMAIYLILIAFYIILEPSLQNSHIFVPNIEVLRTIGMTI